MRRDVIIVAIAALTCIIVDAPHAAEQQKERVARIGYLSTDPHRFATYIEEFRHGLRDLRYVEGQSIIIDWRFAGEAYDRLPMLASELVDLKVDVIVADSTLAAVAAKQVTKTVPIVMVVIADPIGSGLVASLAHPGGNVTGTTIVSPDLTPKRLQLLKEAAPKASRVAMLWNPTHPASRPQLNEAEVAARQLGVRLQPVAASDAGDLASAFAAMAKARAEALLVSDDTMLSSHAARIAAVAVRTGCRRCPAGTYFPTLAPLCRTHRLPVSSFCAWSSTSTRLSKVRSPPTSPWNSPRSLSWSLT